MNRKERFFIASILALVSVLIGLDLMTDSREGVVYWHVIIEGGLALLALFGVFFVLRGSVQLRNRLTSQTDELTQLKKQADVWRAQSRKTARAQSTAIYTKAGLSGRAELAAFFLEDLLVPQSSEYAGLRDPQA